MIVFVFKLRNECSSLGELLLNEEINSLKRDGVNEPGVREGWGSQATDKAIIWNISAAYLQALEAQPYRTTFQ